MKNKIIALLITLVLGSCRLMAQDSSFVGTWSIIENSGNKIKLPTHITFNYYSDSLVIIQNNTDSINFPRIASFSEDTILLKNTYLNTKRQKFEVADFVIYKTEDNSNLIFTSTKTNEKAEYTFLMVCCTNSDHVSKHCADNPTDLKKLKEQGCTNFKRPQ